MDRSVRTFILPLAVTATLLLAGVQSAGAVTHSRPSFRPFVVGGATAGPGTFPWLAFVYSYAGNNVSQCTGTVVSPNVVLTAGHCVIDDQTGLPLAPRAFGVVTGTASWAEAAGRTVSAVTRVIVNPSFDNVTGRDDAALLVLASPTPVPALALQPAADMTSPSPGSAAVFAGWGQTDGADSMSGANTLQWARTVLHSPASCQSDLSPFDPRTQLCANDAPFYGSTVCFGDSGGPLIADGLPGQSGPPVQIGIVRGSPGQCDPRTDVVYTAVRAISTWASAVIRAESSDAPQATTPPPLPFAVALARIPVPAAQAYVRQILAGRFGASGPRRRGYTTRCAQRSPYRVRCGVDWDLGSNEYWGHVSVFYAVANGSAVWSDNYKIKWVNDRCLRSAPRARCRISLARGSD